MPFMKIMDLITGRNDLGQEKSSRRSGEVNSPAATS